METNVGIERIAKLPIKSKAQFLVHLAIYMKASFALALYSLANPGHALLSFALISAWGIAVLFHGIAAFLHESGSASKPRMIENELANYK